MARLARRAGARFTRRNERLSVNGLRPLNPRFRELLVDLDEQTIEAGLVCGFGAGDQHVLRVGGTQEPPAVARADTYAVGRIDPGAVSRQSLTNLLDDCKLAAFVDLEAHFGRGRRLWH